MTERKTVSTSRAPAAIGPYSQAVRAGDLLFCSGQIPLDPSSGEIVGPGDIQAQTRACLKNLQAVLEAGGSSLERVVKTTVFLKDMDTFPAMNQVYREFFPQDPPARAAVEVARLPKDVLVEIQCVALAGN